MKHILVLLTGLTLCFADNPSIVTDTICDEFEQYMLVYTKDSELYGNSYHEQAFLNFAKYVDTTDTAYLLVLEHVGNDWIFIKEGRSLFIKCDDTIMSFVTKRCPDRKTYGMGMVRETAQYPVDTEQMRKIAYAKSGKVKIKGGNKDLVRTIGNKNYVIFRRFVDNIINKKNENR